MRQHEISASMWIPVPAAQVYRTIADYQEGHPRILPKPPFVSLTVLKGGIGAGTEISFVMKVMGKLNTTRAVISEPEPGRVLVETTDSGIISTFTVEPREQNRHAFVTIHTAMPVRNGLLGKLEGWTATQLLFPAYQRELYQLSQVARE